MSTSLKYLVTHAAGLLGLKFEGIMLGERKEDNPNIMEKASNGKNSLKFEIKKGVIFQDVVPLSMLHFHNSTDVRVFSY